MPDGRRLRVFLADDHPIVLAGLKALILSDQGLELLGEAMDGKAALETAIAMQPDVTVLDVSMPGLNGMAVTRQLLMARPQCRVLLLTVHEDAAYLHEGLKSGASGYLLKRSATESLIRGIHAVAAGDTYLDSAIAGHILASKPPRPSDGADFSAAHPPNEREHTLSDREMDAVRLTVAGHTGKTIAAKMRISAKTVETYKARAMAKLGCRSRVDLVRHAVANGWMNDG